MHISEFIQSSNLMGRLFNGDPNSLPFHIYQKDLAGKYIYCNDRMALDAGFDKKEDLLGLSDLDIKVVMRDNLLHFRSNDQYITKHNTTKIFIEPLHFTNRIKFILVSQKMPLMLNHKMIGLMGISLVIKKDSIGNDLFTLLDLSNSNDYQLTQREMEIIRKLVRGYSARQTAVLLHISTRTVEQHIENIKNKMNVTKKQEIIEKILSNLRDD